MSDQNNLLSIFESVGEDMDDQTQKEMEELWKEAAGADPATSVDISEQEVNEAFENVTSQAFSNQNTESASRSYIKYAVAAVFALFAVGLTYALIPVTVHVPHGQTQTVVLPDQSTVQLNSGSEITYSRLFNWRDREVSLRGEAFFNVESNGSPFTVTTPNAAVKVLGTKFNVRFWPSENNNRTTVSLTEGMVTFTSRLAESESVVLKKGEQSWVSNVQQIPTDPVNVDNKKVLAWQQNGIAFENQSLSAVFAELERRFDITIEEHPDIASEKITIYLSGIGSAETALKDICRAKGLTYKKQNDKFLVYRN